MKKVLVIDDTPEIPMIIAESLNLYGFTTLAAEDGVTGIQIAREQVPDLIICDINMPKLDGYATLTAIRQDETTSTIPFIFLSGATEKISVRRGMEMGADDYLTKPFTHKELVSAVNTRLEKQAEMQRHSDKKLDELRGNITLALPQEVLESARYIHESAQRLHRLIENFLVYSQIELMASESKKIETGHWPAPVAVQDIIPDVARGIARKFRRESDLTLNVGTTKLLVPAENLKKIGEELVDNAFKFSE